MTKDFQQCEIPLSNATSKEIVQLFASTKTIAVVGLSPKPERDSHRVAAYLQQQGYRIIPINPNVKEVLGEKAYHSLEAAKEGLATEAAQACLTISEPIEVVDIFRKVEVVPAIVNAAIQIGARAVWMQEGIVHNASAAQARATGLQVVMNKCMLKEHRAMITEH